MTRASAPELRDRVQPEAVHGLGDGLDSVQNSEFQSRYFVCFMHYQINYSTFYKIWENGID